MSWSTVFTIKKCTMRCVSVHDRVLKVMSAKNRKFYCKYIPFWLHQFVSSISANEVIQEQSKVQPQPISKNQITLLISNLLHNNMFHEGLYETPWFGQISVLKMIGHTFHLGTWTKRYLLIMHTVKLILTRATVRQ